MERSGAADWTANQDKEIKFVAGKRFDALVDAVVTTGEVDAHTLPTELLRIIVAEAKRRQKAAMSLSKTPKPHAGPRGLLGANVLVEPSVINTGVADDDAITQALHANGALRTMDRADAHVYIVADPTKMRDLQ